VVYAIGRRAYLVTVIRWEPKHSVKVVNLEKSVASAVSRVDSPCPSRYRNSNIVRELKFYRETFEEAVMQAYFVHLHGFHYIMYGTWCINLNSLES
jgi:hypothetical protein